MINRKENESVLDWKTRLYQNRSKYNLSWGDIKAIFNSNFNPDTIRKASYGYLEAYNDMNNTSFDKKVMLMNDIHLPFERKDVLEEIKKHAHEITHLVIGGDLLDCKSISVFSHSNDLSIIDELKYGYNWLLEVRKILGSEIPIILIAGNHEERFEKMILKDMVLQNFIDPKILRMYEEGFELFIGKKREKFSPIPNLKYVDSWYTNIDDKIVYCHPKDFSSVDGKMTEKVAEYFLNKKECADVYVFAHTHKYCQQTVARRQGVYVVENGCVCQPHEYANSGKLSFTPQHYCYSIISYNNDEKVNPNNIKVYHLDNTDELYEVESKIML